MKLCWENLDHMVLMPGLKGSLEPRLVYVEDIEGWTGSKGEHDLSEYECKNCNNYFLKRKSKNEEFCDMECKREYMEKQRKLKKEEEQKNKAPDKRLKENGGGLHSTSAYRDPWNKGLKTGRPHGTVSFKSYNERISWFVDTRQHPSDKRILQTKCCICGKWMTPTRGKVDGVVNFAYGLQGKTCWSFYCSKGCEDKCPYFRKTLRQITEYDYLNSDKALISEKFNIPDHILYYDWQVELKKKLTPEIVKYKKREQRRRKKTEGELRRAANKKVKPIKDERYERLKRMIYLSKERAKLKGWEFNIDYNWVVENTPEACPKCGVVFSYDMSIKMNPFAPSIDRINPNEGYTKDNCIVVSWMFNCGKNSYDEEELYKICKAYLAFSGT